MFCSRLWSILHFDVLPRHFLSCLLIIISLLIEIFFLNYSSLPEQRNFEHSCIFIFHFLFNKFVDLFYSNHYFTSLLLLYSSSLIKVKFMSVSVDFRLFPSFLTHHPPLSLFIFDPSSKNPPTFNIKKKRGYPF